jgi:hypothetical protein
MAYNFVRDSSQSISSSGLDISVYPVTLSAWAYANSDTISMTIVAWLQAATNQSFRIIFQGAVLGDPVRFNLVIPPFPFFSDKASPGFTINTWHHVCWVCTSSTLREVYVDAVAGASNTVNRTPTNLTRVTIGSQATSQYFTGNISDVAIWSAALNTGEINSLAKGFSAKKIRPQSLEYYVPLVRNLYEYKNKPTLTNNNSATVATHNRIYS